MSPWFVVCWGMLIIARIGAAGFTCPGVGDFPDPSDCKVIHKCKSRGAESNDFLCPPGTIFDQKCVWPHATRRRCDIIETEGPPKSGDQEESEPPGSKSLVEESTNDASFNAKNEVASEDKSGDVSASPTDPAGTASSIPDNGARALNTGPVTNAGQAARRSFYVGSKGFNFPEKSPDANAKTSSEKAELKLYRGNLTPHDHADPLGDASKSLPELEDLGLADRIQDDGRDVTEPVAESDDEENPLQDFGKCLSRFFASVSYLFNKFKHRVMKERLEGSRILNHFSATVGQRMNKIKTAVADDLAKRTSSINHALEHEKAAVTQILNQGKRSLAKTYHASRSFAIGAIETGLGISSDIITESRYLTNNLVTAVNTKIVATERSLSAKANTTLGPYISAPIQYGSRIRKGVLSQVARYLRSAASIVDSWAE